MKILLKVFLYIFFICTFILLLKSMFLTSYPDFRNYYFNPQMAFKGLNPYIGGKNLYTATTYPPFSFILFSPFSIMNFEFAGKLITILSISLLIASLVFIFKTGEMKIKSYVFLLVSGLVFLYFPVKFTLGMGQINIFVLFFLTLFLYFLKLKKILLSGFFLALSFLTKLFPILVFPYLLYKRKYKLLAFSIFVILIVSGLSFILIPKEINFFFYQKILPSLLSSWHSDYYNQSISGFLSRSISNSQARSILRDIFVLFVIVSSVLILAKSKLKNMNFEAGYLVIITLLIDGFSWQHHFTWLILPFIFTLFLLIKTKQSKFPYALLFISYFLTAINFRSPSSLHVLLQSHVFFGALLLWILDSILILRTSVEAAKRFPKRSNRGL